MAEKIKSQTLRISLADFPLTETKNFNGTYVLSNPKKNVLILRDCHVNPQNKRVYFGKLMEEDLDKLMDTFSKKPISADKRKHNQFAFYYHQIIK
jgi:hypothetical protein